MWYFPLDINYPLWFRHGPYVGGERNGRTFRLFVTRTVRITWMDFISVVESVGRSWVLSCWLLIQTEMFRIRAAVLSIGPTTCILAILAILSIQGVFCYNDDNTQRNPCQSEKRITPNDNMEYEQCLEPGKPCHNVTPVSGYETICVQRKIEIGLKLVPVSCSCELVRKWNSIPATFVRGQWTMYIMM